jgi:hypothetical protein
MVMIGLAAVVSFFFGSFLTTLFVRWARSRELHSEYALPLLVEALLLFFGLRGAAGWRAGGGRSAGTRRPGGLAHGRVCAAFATLIGHDSLGTKRTYIG